MGCRMAIVYSVFNVEEIMTEKELFEHMKGSTFVEIDSLALEAIIQSRERKAFEAGADWAETEGDATYFMGFSDYLASPEYLSTESESLSTKEGGIVNE